MTEVKVPSLGVAISSVKIVSIKKQVGEMVKSGEVIAEAESDKVSFQLFAPEDGVILKYFAGVGDVINVGGILALIGREDEDQDVAVSKDDKVPDKVRIYPAARKLLTDYGLEITAVKGTGPAGAITKEDVIKAVESKKSIVTDKMEEADGKALEEEYIPFVGMRKTIADNMMKSLQTVAHVTTVAEVDMTAVVDLRTKMVEELGEEYREKISYVSFVAKSVAKAIKDFPMVNSSLENDRIVVKKYVNMGVAVALDGGLVVPVIRNVEKKSFLELDNELSLKIGEARKGKLLPEDMKGGTITISNAGAFGAILATPIISQPQTALIWLGRIVKRPVVVDDEIVVRRMMYLCISYDHRVVDGAIVASFAQNIRGLLENPLCIITGGV